MEKDSNRDAKSKGVWVRKREDIRASARTGSDSGRPLPRSVSIRAVFVHLSPPVHLTQDE